MSTQEVAALIGSVNNLTDTVAGKMGDIDKRVDKAEQEFETLTTQEFPRRVQEARAINIYIDPKYGDDNDVGTTPAAAFKTGKPVYKLLGGNSPIYDNVYIRFRCGFEYVLDLVACAKKRIVVTGWDVNGGTLTLKQSSTAGSSGAPHDPFRAEEVFFIEPKNEAMNLVIKTFQYPVGHVWEGAKGRPDSWQALSAAFVRDASVVKLDGCHIELYDAPFSSQYLSGSMNDAANTGLVIAGGTKFYKKAAGPGAANFSHMPYLMHVYGNNKLPVDISSSGFVLAENLSSFGELFNNLNGENVRSTHTLD